MSSVSQPLSVLRKGHIAPHRHLQPYAAVVRAGRYVESNGDARLEIDARRVAFHGTLSFHANIVGDAGARVLNIPLSRDEDWPIGVFESDIEAPGDPHELLSWCAQATRAAPTPAPDWLRDFAALSITMPVMDAARAVGVSREHATRAYRAHYLMSPMDARHGARLQQLASALQGDEPLGACALAAGYADQPHMTRAVRTLTGMSPAHLRRSLRCH